MFRLVQHALRWFKRTRQTRSRTGYWVHLGGQWLAVGLMIYWWRAMLHLIETVEAIVAGWTTSNWGHFAFADGLIAIPVHLVAEPIYFLQLLVIFGVCYLTVNREGYGAPAFIPSRLSHGGAFLFSAIMLMRR